MKIIILFILIICSSYVNAQTSPCVQVDCKDTVQLPEDSIALNSIINGAYITATWSQTSGFAATISNPTSLNTVAHGLKPGLYTFQMKADNGFAIDSVVVLPALVDSAGIIKAYLSTHPCPPQIPQRTANGMKWDAVLKKVVITYDDNSNSNL